MDKDLLFKPRLTEDDVEVPGVGVVRVRALTRLEALEVAGTSMPQDVMERRLLSMAMVDPRLTEGEVRLWQEAAPAGEIEPIAKRIQQLSGLVQESARDAYQSFRDGPEPGVGALHRGAAGDDGGPAAGGDAGG